MATDYEKFYQENPHGLGAPTKEFVEFFKNYQKKNARILDIGCGQGRDALFIARLGHTVTAIDIAPTGIRDLLRDANAEGLGIEGIVADIRDTPWTGEFDIVVVDRTLHMLDATERDAVLAGLMDAVNAGGSMLIADEKSNLPAFRARFDEGEWEITLAHRGFLFVRRT